LGCRSQFRIGRARSPRSRCGTARPSARTAPTWRASAPTSGRALRSCVRKEAGRRSRSLSSGAGCDHRCVTCRVGRVSRHHEAARRISRRARGWRGARRQSEELEKRARFLFLRFLPFLTLPYFR
jgi:hypothetical protein